MLIASPSRRRAATLVAVAAWGVLGGPALAQGVTADAPYRLGFNHVRLVGSCLVGDPLATPAAVLADIAALGGQGFRHVEGADVSWWQLLELGGAIDFEGPYALDPPPATGSDSSPDCAFGPDDYLLNDLDLYGLPTLFQTGYAGVLANLDEDLAEALDAADWDRFFALSALIQTVGPSSGRSEPDAMYTPTGAELDVADPEVAAQVQAYVTAMVTAYRAGTHHWEVGNETELNTHHNDLFFAYKPRIYAELLEAVGEAARQADPGAQVVFGGLSTPPNSDGSLVNPPWHRWLDRVLNKGGGDHFDVLSFHFYPADFPDGWRSLKPTIDTLKDLLTDHDAAGKALWLTEVGIGVTDVGEEQQAGDMARMLTIAFGNGVQLVNWHTHISVGDDPDVAWSGYGVRDPLGQAYRSAWTYQLYASQLGNFAVADAFEQGAGVDGVYSYLFYGGHDPTRPTVPGRWVLWADQAGGSSGYDLTARGVLHASARVTDLVPDAAGRFTQHVEPADALHVAQRPMLVEECDGSIDCGFVGKRCVTADGAFTPCGGDLSVSVSVAGEYSTRTVPPSVSAPSGGLVREVPFRVSVTNEDPDVGTLAGELVVTVRGATGATTSTLPLGAFDAGALDPGLELDVTVDVPVEFAVLAEAGAGDGAPGGALVPPVDVTFEVRYVSGFPDDDPSNDLVTVSVDSDFFLPDLVVTLSSVGVQRSLGEEPSKSLAVSAIVTNDRPVATEVGAGLALYVNGVRHAAVMVAAVPAGASVPVELTVVLEVAPTDTCTYDVRAVIDKGDAVVEGDETNNSAAREVHGGCLDAAEEAALYEQLLDDFEGSLPGWPSDGGGGDGELVPAGP